MVEHKEKNEEEEKRKAEEEEEKKETNVKENDLKEAFLLGIHDAGVITTTRQGAEVLFNQVCNSCKNRDVAYQKGLEMGEKLKASKDLLRKDEDRDRNM